mgnify:CR=1 FL=1
MIDSYSFGRYIIDGKEYTYDIKIIEGRVSTWRNHDMKVEDILDLVEAQPEIIVIGTGASGVLKVKQEIADLIKSKGIELIIAKTGRACSEFNRLEKEGRKVCAILHGTC